MFWLVNGLNALISQISEPMKRSVSHAKEKNVKLFEIITGNSR